MKVQIEADVLDSNDVLTQLDRLLDVLLTGRHHWHEPDPERLSRSRWASDTGRAGVRVREGIEKLLVSQLYQGAPRATRVLTITVTLTPAPPHALHPRDALRALELPLFVIVENGESDRAFLVAMCKAFEREDVLVAIRENRIELISAGGSGELEKRVRECLEKIGDGPRRVFVLSDSDRLVPGEVTSTTRKVAKLTGDYDVKTAILRKREVENYLPYEALWDLSGKRERCAAFLQLSQAQRDHYDMKKGFRRDRETGGPQIPDKQRSLFEAVRPRRLLEDLVDGFGDRIWRCFESERITAEAIRALCLGDDQEIPGIIDAIEQMV